MKTILTYMIVLTAFWVVYIIKMNETKAHPRAEALPAPRPEAKPNPEPQPEPNAQPEAMAIKKKGKGTRRNAGGRKVRKKGKQRRKSGGRGSGKRRQGTGNVVSRVCVCRRKENEGNRRVCVCRRQGQQTRRSQRRRRRTTTKKRTTTTTTTTLTVVTTTTTASVTTTVSVTSVTATATVSVVTTTVLSGTTIAAAVINPDTTSNYCDPALCGGATHIACGDTGQFNAGCSADRSLVDISTVRDIIVDQHNKLRSQQATGNTPGYQPAVRMGTLKWDPELARIAEVNARSCTFGHDQCRNTNTFRVAGQNLGISGRTDGYEDPATIATNLINGWFSENTLGTQANINAFSPSPNGEIGHFTLEVADRATAIGCAISRFQSGGFFQSYLVCNYSFNNVVGGPVYVSGPVASQCITGQNPLYPGLCTVNEPILSAL